MSDLFARTLSLAQDFLDRQPDLALMLGAALATYFARHAFAAPSPAPASTLSPASPAASTENADQPHGWWRTLARGAWRCAAAGVLTIGLIALHTGLKTYLGQIDRHFSAHHGRVTEANQQAVRTIWGHEQRQYDLAVELGYEEEVEERVQSADIEKPDIIHKIKKHRTVPANPFRAERHEVTLKTNARKKGSAVYAGYETTCRFTWDLWNPADREVKAVLRFPLPSAWAVYFGFALTFDGVDVLPQAHFENGALVLERTLAPGQPCKLDLAFQSRGLAWWYFQIASQRELRDFTLQLTLADVPAGELNYPEGCMTPTQVTPNDGGAILTYRLDHALTNKGMGVSLPALTQPGQAAGGVLGETGRGFTMFLALALIGLTILRRPNAALFTALACVPLAYGFGLLSDLSDTALPFWAAAGLSVLPMSLLTLMVLGKIAGPRNGLILAGGLALLGVAYPFAAGLDDSRFMLYRNIAALIWLGTVTLLLYRSRSNSSTAS